MTCHVDEVSQKEVYPDCVIDLGKPHDCNAAVVLVSEGKTRDHCPHWLGVKLTVQKIPEKVKK